MLQIQSYCGKLAHFNWKVGVNVPVDEKELLMDIAGKVGRLEALQAANAQSISDMAANVNRLVDKWDKSDDIARDADQRARSAHHRINTIEKVMFWAGTSLILGMAGIIWKQWFGGVVH